MALHGRPLASCLLLIVLAVSARAQAPKNGPAKLPDPRVGLSDIDLSPDVVQQLLFLDQAVRRLERQAAGSRDLASSYEALGHLYLHWELAEEAEAVYEIGSQRFPGELHWWYYLGFLSATEGAAAQAVARFEEALLFDPENIPTLLRLGDLELELGHPRTAERRFAAAVAVDSESAAAWHGLGRAAAALGNNEAAIASFERTLELQPQATTVHYALAQAYRRHGDLDSARRHLERFRPGKVKRQDPLVERLGVLSTTASINLVKALAGRRESFPDPSYVSYSVSFLGSLAAAPQRLAADLEAWPAELRERDAVTRGRLHLAIAALLSAQGREPEARAEWLRAAALLTDLDETLWRTLGS